MATSRRAIALSLILAGVVLLAALGWLAYSGSRETKLRGVVTNVESRDIGHAAAIMVLATDGGQHRFLMDPSVDIKWTPGHLRDHMLFARPVTVHYRRSGSDLVAHKITD